MQRNLFAIRKAKLFSEACDAGPASEGNHRTARFSHHYSSDVPEWKEQRACKHVIKPAFMSVPFSS